MNREVKNQIDRALAGVRQPYRAVISTCASDTPVQLAQIDGLAGETTPDVELLQQYGITSNPPSGTMAVVVPLGGKTSHGVIVATEHASYRIMSLKPGEIAIYTDEGDSLVFRRGRVIDITTETLNIKASTAVNIDTPIVNMTKRLNVQEQITGQGGMAVSGGDGVEVDGSMRVTQDVEAGGKSLVHHKHPGDSGGTTGEPI
ncbi:phage baseplate assembly protein V [Burkholderia cenocepacia]|uniref:phage baseplate assembly protein V n=1 Tax=Burkholderia cenocepacia TaxID=95486 RepID=UPI00209C79EF|nr:phage baseplate assembly protein V [Burkholderia cenocepacia]MCO8326801.1 phage baseplate assembly protein V [Burkholderia cenocepacia]MCO8333864.1 phage baseplate assembly protein V [Burkholderia cenocepacia]MCO8341237.1 phage baseplate assembly protein V [Burkholderia cenocepacia]MCO8348657.1 phage baseplate assembly protein V [Burkholderia cenocepacia]MCO8361849.1 phage baseplate assembly protein V [Burkholderia cenocepacia]